MTPFMLTLLACGPQVDLEANPPASHVAMGLTYGQAQQARDAVIRGNPAEASMRLAELYLDAGMFPASGPQAEPQEAFIAVAQEATRAESLSELAQGVAKVSAACGDCHAAAGAQLPHLSAKGAAEGSSMQRHYKAVHLAWEGLVAPSDPALAEAFTAIAEMTLIPDRPFSDELLRKAGQLEGRVNRLAAQVASADAPKAKRVEAYGELLLTCSSCHSYAGGGPERWIPEEAPEAPEAPPPAE
ncbi:MAG: hypothetical protein H6740_08480 [Alphaproteobacteria bacterium]|nr:hypothetical protein [Alphaproteobacteria bacterium]